MTKIVWISDTHINSPVGLLNPSISLGDGSTRLFSEWQKKLWKSWIDFWDQTGRVEWLVLGGDILDIDDKNRSTVISRNYNDVMTMAGETLAPALEKAKKVIVIRGTEAHVGVDGQHEERLARDISNCVWADKGKKIASHYHFVGTLSGSPKLDLAHHAKGSLIPRSRGNAVNQLAADIELYYLRRGEVPPAYALRGHVHQFQDSGTNFPTRVLTSGCWTGSNPYSYRISMENTPPDIGGIVLTFERANHGIQKIKYSIEQNHRSRHLE